MDVNARRRFYAEEIAAVANLTSAALVEALAATPRERFLPPGPWTVVGEGDMQSVPRRTPDADPRHVYHNYAIALDASRQLFNGAPALVARAIDALGLAPGASVLHIGAGSGYYSALMAACVGPRGRVLAIEVDPALAAEARANLEPHVCVRVAEGDGATIPRDRFDAILVNAGVTHPLVAWLDALGPAGRIVLPITVPMGPTLGKGPMFLLTRTADPDVFDVRLLSLVAIYSALGIRDPAVEQEVAARMRVDPVASAAVRRLRRDAHEPTPSCWLHLAGWCLSR